MKPHLVLVSDSIRRDLHDPLRYFKKVRITHLYRKANYGDMTAEDFAATPAKRFSSPVDLWRLLRQLHPDLIQSIEPSAGRRALVLSFGVWLYAKSTGTPYLFAVAENVPLRQKHGWLWGGIIAWWLGVVGRAAVAVIPLNDGAEQILGNAGVPSAKFQRRLWGNWGINIEEFKPLKSPKPLKPIVLFIGKISVAKGIPWLIEAMDEVIKSIPAAQLWVAGLPDPSFELPKRTYIKQLGTIKNKDVAALMRQAAVVASPSVATKSWAEQIGNVNLQAMACGVPVVTTRSGSIPEYVKDGQGAILVPERDSQALSQAIVKLLTDDKVRLQQGKLARKWVVSRYDARRNIAKLDDWLENLRRSR